MSEQNGHRHPVVTTPIDEEELEALYGGAAGGGMTAPITVDAKELEELLDDGIEEAGMRDAATGLFIAGHRKLGGSRKGQESGRLMNLMTIVRRRAAEIGLDPEEMVWAVFRGLSLEGAKGDAPAGKIVLDRMCGMLEKGLQVNVDASVNAEPSVVPQRRKLAVQLLEMREVAAGILKIEDETDELLT